MERDGSYKIIDMENGMVGFFNKEGKRTVVVDNKNKIIRVNTTASNIQRHGMIGDLREKLVATVSWKDFCEFELGINYLA